MTNSIWMLIGSSATIRRRLFLVGGLCTVHNIYFIFRSSATASGAALSRQATSSAPATPVTAAAPMLAASLWCANCYSNT